MDQIRELLPVIFSVASLAVSGYLWLVRTNRERPNFHTAATSPVDRLVCIKGRANDRTEAVSRFVRADAADQSSPAGAGSYCFLFRAVVVNGSSLPHAVARVRAAVKTSGGEWLGLNTAFVLSEGGIGGPFDLSGSNPPRALVEPQSFVVPPDHGREVKVLAWFDIPLGADQFVWQRTADTAGLVRAFGDGRLAAPLTMRVEVTTLQGKTFVTRVDTTGATVPPAVTVSGIAPPPLARFAEALRPKQLDDAIATMKVTLAEAGDPTTGLVVREGETAGAFGSDLEPTVYAALASLALGGRLDQPAFRDWLLSRQNPDGTFRQNGGSLDAASPVARMTNIHVAVRGLGAVGAKPAANPLPAYAAALAEYAKAQTDYGKPVRSAFALMALEVVRAVGPPASPELDGVVRATLDAARATPASDDNVESGVWVPARLAELRGEAMASADEVRARFLNRPGSAGYMWQNDDYSATPQLLAEGFRAARLLGAPAPVLDRMKDELAKQMVDSGVRNDADAVKDFYFVTAFFVAAGLLKPSLRPTDSVGYGMGEFVG